MGSICTKIALVTIERTHFIQSQNRQIYKTYIKRTNISKTSPWKAHFPITPSFWERKMLLIKKELVSQAYSELGTPFCSLDTSFTHIIATFM